MCWLGLFEGHVNHLDSFLMLPAGVITRSPGRLGCSFLGVLILIIANSTSSQIACLRRPPLLHARCQTGVLNGRLGQCVSICEVAYASTTYDGNGAFALRRQWRG